MTDDEYPSHVRSFVPSTPEQARDRRRELLSEKIDAMIGAVEFVISHPPNASGPRPSWRVEFGDVPLEALEEVATRYCQAGWIASISYGDGGSYLYLSEFQS